VQETVGVVPSEDAQDGPELAAAIAASLADADASLPADSRPPTRGIAPALSPTAPDETTIQKLAQLSAVWSSGAGVRAGDAAGGGAGGGSGGSGGGGGGGEVAAASSLSIGGLLRAFLCDEDRQWRCDACGLDRYR